MPNLIEFDLDAFSDGQVRSKLWLLSKLENFCQSQPGLQQGLRLGFLASWYGSLPLFLLTREKLKVLSMDLFDVDADSLKHSRKILEHWWIHGMPMKFHHLDVNQIEYNNYDFNFVVNTSCEHIQELDWFHQLPVGMWFLFQSTNMPHVQHVRTPKNLHEFTQQFAPYCDLYLSESLNFHYPDKSFERFMVIGQKIRQSYRDL